MSKKLWALGLVAAAAYLFKTEKGAEIRKQIGEVAGKAAGTLKEKYKQSKESATTLIDG